MNNENVYLALRLGSLALALSVAACSGASSAISPSDDDAGVGYGGTCTVSTDCSEDVPCCRAIGSVPPALTGVCGKADSWKADVADGSAWWVCL